MVAAETRDVLCAEVLCVLDAETPVAWPVFLLDLLVDVENRVVGPVADGVDDDL